MFDNRLPAHGRHIAAAMKTQARFAIILATVLAMTLSYLGGMVVSAQFSPAPTGPHAPALTSVQWAALEAATSLLLLDSEGDMEVHLPLIIRH